MLLANQLVPGSSRRIASIEECRPELQEIYALWLKMRGDRRMPARRDFDPVDAHKLLPHMILVDVFAGEPRERRYRMRLMGTAQVTHAGSDWTGAYLHEKTDREAADRLCDVGDHILESREPWISTGNVYYMPNKSYSQFEGIILPLSDDDDRVNMLLGLSVYF